MFVALIVSLTAFINKPYDWRDLTIFLISFISSFEIFSAVVLDQKKILLKVLMEIEHF